MRCFEAEIDLGTDDELYSYLSTGEVIPGDSVPDDDDHGTEDDWRSWITNGFAAVSHPIGTLAMMKRSLGGALYFLFDLHYLIVVQVSSTLSSRFTTPLTFALLTLQLCRSKLALIFPQGCMVLPKRRLI